MPYVESPFDRIVGVNFGRPGFTTIFLSFSATPNSGTYGGDQFVMTVSTINIPLLERTTLMAPTEDFGGDSVVGSIDGPPGNPFGFISGSYTLGQSGQTGQGSVNYLSGSAAPFGGAGVIAITITVQLRHLFLSDGSGYSTSAEAVANVKGSGDISRTLTGTAPNDGTISFTATLDIATSTLTLE